jgi:CheY-like chemotaxis protein
VTSEPNKGSEFAFFVEMEQHQEAAGDEHVNNDAAVEQRYDGFTLLLVEDIEINQEIAKFVLSEMGFEIDIADNGENGVNAFLKKDYDLIFMDIFMPIMDGLEATRKIRRIEKERASSDANNPHPPRVPIIAMTANAMQEDQKLSKEAGMDGHIAKPLDIDEIKAILYKTLIKSK